MKNGNFPINNNDLSSHLDLNLSNQEEKLPIKCPYNYQFYFDNIQIVGEENFEKDYIKIYKRNRKNTQNLIQTPQTFSTSSTKKSLILYKNVLLNNFVKDKIIKDKIKKDNKLIFNKNNNYDINFKNNNDKKELKNKKTKKELNEEKMQSSCCLIF